VRLQALQDEGGDIVSAAVTIVQQFPRQTRERTFDPDAKQRAVKPRLVSRRELRQVISQALEDINGPGAECGFWACPGPDKPTRWMMTCRACYGIKRLRVLLGWLAEEDASKLRHQVSWPPEQGEHREAGGSS
jgi:hypothetical protein